MTCADACGGLCCEDTNACMGFTGKVCKDGSCSGQYSCINANIGFLKDGCKGEFSCSAMKASAVSTSCKVCSVVLRQSFHLISI